MGKHNSAEAPKKKTSVWSKLMRYGIPLIISVGLCVVLFRDMDFAEMYRYVRSDCDFSLILLSMAIGFLCLVARALRWRIQLRASGIDAPLAPILYSIIGTYAVNLVLPRLGELWRSEYVARREKAPFGTVFGSMVAERASDTLTVLTMTIAAFLLGGATLKSFIYGKIDQGSAMFRIFTSPWTYVAIAAAIAITILIMKRYGHSSFIDKARKLIRDLIGGFMSIFHMKGGGMWLFWTACLWGGYFLQMWACFEAFGLTRGIVDSSGLVVVYVCFVLGSISMGVPSNGGIGPYQIAVVFGLQCYMPEINEQHGYSFANVVLGAQTLLFIVGGLIAFLLIAIDNRRLAKQKDD